MTARVAFSFFSQAQQRRVGAVAHVPVTTLRELPVKLREHVMRRYNATVQEANTTRMGDPTLF